jgi:hypothetical protein
VGDEVTLHTRVLVAALATLAACCAQGQWAGIGDVNASSDADHFDAFRIRTGALFSYASPYRYMGLAAQTTHYDQSGWQRDAPAILFLWRNQQRDTLTGTIAEGGVVRVAGRMRLIGDATWSLRPTVHTGVELIAAGDIVETQRALDRATTYTLLGISAEQQLTKRVTVIGLGGYQHFTDGNARVHLRGRLIWLLVPEHGITAQLRWRRYDTQQLDVDGAYFNPGRYSDWQAGLAIRKRHAGWLWSGTVAAGREQIDRNVRQTTKLAELRTEGTAFRDLRIVLHASYNRSAGFASAEGYWYRLIGVTVVVPFRTGR